LIRAYFVTPATQVAALMSSMIAEKN